MIKINFPEVTSDQIKKLREEGYSNSISLNINGDIYNFSGIELELVEGESGYSLSYLYNLEEKQIEISIKLTQITDSTSYKADVSLTYLINGEEYPFNTEVDTVSLTWAIDNSLQLREDNGYIPTEDPTITYYYIPVNPEDYGGYEDYLNLDPHKLKWYERVGGETLEDGETIQEGMSEESEVEEEDQEITEYELSKDTVAHYYPGLAPESPSGDDPRRLVKYYYYKVPKEYFTRGQSNVSDSSFIRLDKYGLYGVNLEDSTDTYTPYSIEDIQDKADFSLTWKGYTLKTHHPDGDGRVVIGSSDDIAIYDGEEKVAAIGYLKDIVSQVEYRIKGNGTKVISAETMIEYTEVPPTVQVKTAELEGNPNELGWYEKKSDNYVLTEDTIVSKEKVYYTRQEQDWSGIRIVDDDTISDFYLWNKAENIWEDVLVEVDKETKTFTFPSDTPSDGENDWSIKVLTYTKASKKIEEKYGIYASNLYIGDENNYLSYYFDDDGEGKFVIRTDDLYFSSDYEGHSSVKSLVGDLNILYNSLNSWIAFGEKEVDNEKEAMLTIGKQDGKGRTSSVNLTGDEIAFIKDGEEVITISSQDGEREVASPRYLVKERLRFNSNYAFISTNGDKNLSLKYLGE